VKFKTSWNISLQVPKIKDFLHPYFCYAKTSVNNNIMPNFKIALQNLEQLNQKSGATQ